MWCGMARCHGDVRSVHAVHTRFLQNLAARTPLLPGADQLVFLDIDAKKKQVHGHQRDGARRACTGATSLDYLMVTMTGPLFAPVVLTARLRDGAAHSCRGAASMIREAIGLARRCGVTGMIVVRGDSGFYTSAVITAIRKAGARFSITARDHHNAITTAISEIPENAWQPVTYDRPVFDQDSETWVHTAEVAQTGFTAFTNTTQHPDGPVAAGLVVRRIPDRGNNSGDSTGQQRELFTAWRYQAIFTDSGFNPADTDHHHRGRARIEQVLADLNNSAAAHLPSGKFAASAAWLILACLTHNLLRATGCLASRSHSRATTGTLRRHLVQVAARVTSTARTLTLRLPQHWPWADTWLGLFHITHAPPTPA
ncbi:IS1380 family transposase [Lentzea flava]|uniref:IS1380 family transposase n=1 Tax=Lentzea flava TaxID=103732 RepID=UPI003FD76F89|nr:Transposase DDE domain group 1 [Lentzea flava]